MASKTAILSVRILGDAKGAISAMGEVEGRSSKLGGIVKGAGGIIAGAAAAGGAALVGLGAAGVMAAGDLEQSIGAVDSVFKGSADQVHAFADTAATELGLTGNEYRELATLMGTQLKNGGTALEDLGGKTHELMGLGADLSSMFGGSTTDAVSAISSALKGERDPIEKFGVSLKQAGIDARAAEMGFTKVGGALSDEAQQAATLSLIMEQTADAHGNFGKETGTMAGQVQIATAQWGNFTAQIGMLLLPILTTLLTFLTGSVMPGLQELATVIGPHITAAISQVGPFISGLLSNFGSLASGSGILQTIITAVSTAFSLIAPAVMSFLPALMSFGQSVIPVIIGAVQALIPIIMQIASVAIPAILGVVQRVLPIVQGVITTVVPAIISAVQTLIPMILGLVPPIMSIVNSVIGVLGPAIQWLLPIVTGIFGAIVTQIQGAIQIITAVLSAVAALLRGDFSGAWEAIKGVVGGAITFVKGIIQQGMAIISGITGQSVEQVKSTFKNGFALVVSTVTGKVTELIGKVKAIPGQIKSALGNLGSLLTSAGKDLIQGMINGIGSMGQALKNKASGLANGAVDSIKGSLGIASPSKVMIQVGKWTGEGLIKGVEKMQRGAAGAMAGLVTVPDAPRIPLSFSGSSSTRTSAGGERHVHVHIEGAFVGDRIGLAREIEQLLSDRRVLVGEGA